MHDIYTFNEIDAVSCFSGSVLYIFLEFASYYMDVYVKPITSRRVHMSPRTVTSLHNSCYACAPPAPPHRL